MILGDHDPRAHIRPLASGIAGFLFAVAVLLAGLGAASAQPVLSLTGPVSATALPASLEYRIDPEWQLSVADLADPEATGWQPVGATTPDFGYTAARIWLRVTLHNATPDTDDWRLFICLLYTSPSPRD